MAHEVLVSVGVLGRGFRERVWIVGIIGVVYGAQGCALVQKILM